MKWEKKPLKGGLLERTQNILSTLFFFTYFQAN
jgi:hypothetical protein